MTIGRAFQETHKSANLLPALEKTSIARHRMLVPDLETDGAIDQSATA